MYQKCPVCNGTGYECPIQDIYTTAIKYPNVCTVCQGAKIINEKTGLPPKMEYDVLFSNGTTTTAEQVEKFMNEEKIQGL